MPLFYSRRQQVMKKESKNRSTKGGLFSSEKRTQMHTHHPEIAGLLVAGSEIASSFSAK
jgi:hypothetical protein